MTTAAEDLANLNDDEFKEALTGDKEFYGDIGETQDFAPYLDTLNAFRTYLVLADIKVTLEAKIKDTVPSTDAAIAWMERAGRFLKLVDLRLTQVQTAIRIQRLEARDRANSAPALSKAQALKPYKRLAHDLCAALDNSGDPKLLELLYSIPSVWPDLSAGEWYRRRLANQQSQRSAA